MKTVDYRENWKNEDTDRLFRAVLSLKNEIEAEAFFRDLMTEQEIQTFAERLKVAELLVEKVSYREIYKRTKVSTATITRINQWLERGMGGYKLAISRLNSNTEHQHTKTATVL
ncbi:MAG: TrpR like protein, YerC/YecD [Candidatus Collierbacteria bacterium GW2011_GWC2_44_18]|uniref:TrpR like protein, YerC/YecD n=1 Tax=Candidatus Collierbacteria bacterium GW2011_GWC2_44_18 TaxID=1618392 RepID=A0A0G1KM37_9BACT|nr:MAG: TrpR like protein, YerC/YecD [Microgenomates group bacterium GW2011_GWC1_44_10]KKT49019.1 MAG: TrpR like protein, YerC/YecD [Candidatus Collierbacteria bacterium GW2011_GWC2_44_18]